MIQYQVEYFYGIMANTQTTYIIVIYRDKRSSIVYLNTV